MGSLKALQEWCRIQCENYTGVEIKNMSASFRDGLAFCAIIHRHRPDLIDFDSLSKDNVYENNHLAFETAESELGIPALLDAEDMVSMKVPDRLSIITYVSQYYNYFTNKSHANPPCMKRPSGTGHTGPAVKRPVALDDERAGEAKSAPVQTGVDDQSKRSTLSSTCAACQKHVHLVQRFLADGKLYHRNCFRCRECCSTLLPGSYKAGSEAGSLVCTHHFTKSFSANQNGRPDLSRLTGPMVGKGGGLTPAETPPTVKAQEMTPLQDLVIEEDSMSDSPEKEDTADREETETGVNEETETGVNEETETGVNEETETGVNEETERERERERDQSAEEEGKETGGGASPEVEEEPQPSSPPNPFDASDEEEEKGEEKEDRKLEEGTANGGPPSTPVSHFGGPGRPVPAPRRMVDPSPPPRPVPRARPPRVTDSCALNGDPGDASRTPPKPRERSHSPGSLSSETPKPKDPPWLALVHSEPRKKPAPPPPTGMATPPQSGSVPSVRGEGGSRPATPPQPANPFEDDEEGEEEPGEEGGGLAPPAVAASHPWYGISPAADSPAGGSPRSKKRPAPRAPRASPTAPPLSQPSSTSPSPALSTESLSSSSDHSSTRPPPGARVPDQEHPFTKSVSEPSISEPSDSSANHQPRTSSGPALPPPPANTSSAPATPQTNRSAGLRAARPPPPRPPSGPSPLAKAGTPTPPPASAHGKRTCKENPFNRKASPSVTPPKSRPPKGPRPARPPAPGHGFPLIKRKVQSDQYIPVEDIHVEMGELERQLDELEQRGVELESKLRDCQNDEEEEAMLVDWFTLIHNKHMLVRREAVLVYTAKQQNLEERQADVEYELRCLLNKPEKEWSEEDRARDQELMAELVTIIEQRNHIINSMDQDRQRDEEEDKVLEAMLKRKDFHKEMDAEQKKKGGKFKPMKVLKMLSQKGEGGKSKSPRKEKS
ncbi:MICAL-like protein 1 isoform X2 [Conger conger]|uniref:MICAL-like protein 1 isoform X2 n=1 Tax=Conger conger TaxID=82655 RepID=UPI002A5A8323|nr:MICAL-like protein 1 isoform X2 [Conger conger]